MNSKAQDLIETLVNSKDACDTQVDLFATALYSRLHHLSQHCTQTVSHGDWTIDISARFPSWTIEIKDKSWATSKVLRSAYDIRNSIHEFADPEVLVRLVGLIELACESELESLIEDSEALMRSCESAKNKLLG